MPIPDGLYALLVTLAAIEIVAGVALVAISAVRRRLAPPRPASPALMQFGGAALFVEGVLQYLFWALLNSRDHAVVWVIGALAFIAVPLSAYQRARAIRREHASTAPVSDQA